MKFDPTQWYEVDTGEGVINEGPIGLLKVRCSVPCALYVIAPSPYEGEADLSVLVGWGADFHIRMNEELGPISFYLTGPKEARAFLFVGKSKAVAAREGSYTNPERPFSMESEAYSAILGDVRRFKLDMKLQMDGMRRDAHLREQRLIAAEKARQAAESRAAVVIPRQEVQAASQEPSTASEGVPLPAKPGKSGKAQDEAAE